MLGAGKLISFAPYIVILTPLLLGYSSLTHNSIVVSVFAIVILSILGSLFQVRYASSLPISSTCPSSSALHLQPYHPRTYYTETSS